jgi:glutamine cyclotransferase
MYFERCMAFAFRFLRHLLFGALVAAPVAARAQAPVASYRVVATLPHSTSNYTEGFFYLNGLFYESTGIEGHSEILVSFPDTGHMKTRTGISPQYFGEGIVDWGRYLYQWTWQSHIGWIYDRRTMTAVRSFTYTGEGWGMTHDAAHLITSDGSATLRFRNPGSFAEVRSITVRDVGGRPVDMLNELEYIKGEIYANVWHTDRIARISPQDGHVIGWIDLTGLEPDAVKRDPEAVLNGIAYDATHDRLFVTGKLWRHIYEIKVVPPSK